MPVSHILRALRAITGREIGKFVRQRGRLLAALVRLTERLMTTPSEEPLRRRLFGSFTPLEAEGLQRNWRDAAHLATARVDFLVLAWPIGSLLVFALAAIVAGMIAAIFPARRAARLNVLQALQYE